MAILGGLVLSALVILTVLSITGRSLNGILHSDMAEASFPVLADWLLGLGVGPVTGDFELVEAGMAFAIFCFLPLCQITYSHASVDVFTNMMSARVRDGLRVVTDVIFAAVLVLIAVQLSGGLASKFRSGQTTFLLEMPVWWAYAACMLGAALSAVVGVYIAAMRLAEVTTGRPLLPARAEDEA